jgi:superfamily II DNA or RNA helicase
VLVCDEVHQATAQATRDFIEKCPAKIKIGCSGTLPKDKFQMWQLVGMLGRVVYREEVTSLQDKGYISKLKITLLDILHREVEGNRNYLFNLNPKIKYHQDEFG